MTYPVSSRGSPLHFKQTAYNWLTFCVEQPPVTGLMVLPYRRPGTGSSRFRGIVPRLVNAMSDNVVFKLNAGKNIGNYTSQMPAYHETM